MHWRSRRIIGVNRLSDSGFLPVKFRPSAQATFIRLFFPINLLIAVDGIVELFCYDGRQAAAVTVMPVWLNCHRLRPYVFIAFPRKKTEYESRQNTSSAIPNVVSLDGRGDRKHTCVFSGANAA